jgi:hypothetical protein
MNVPGGETSFVHWTLRTVVVVVKFYFSLHKYLGNWVVVLSQKGKGAVIVTTPKTVLTGVCQGVTWDCIGQLDIYSGYHTKQVDAFRLFYSERGWNIRYSC